MTCVCKRETLVLQIVEGDVLRAVWRSYLLESSLQKSLYPGP